ncbi:MAG: hypothetical protein BGO01_03620 [Armatimonadetes bacterium 55-13]|nr:hypothetical protein [Armatimonadota bacterium]OJU63036.1 MAG: hypothetical protein BGO01_03620 [Armatimonadetes bacterium 55-13]
MANLTNNQETNLLNWLLRSQSWTQPTNCYLALFTTACTDSALGTEVSTSGTAYARANIGVGTSNWSAPADDSGSQMTSNANAISFTTATASWGTVTHGALMTVSSGGTISDVLVWFAFDTSQTINSGNQVVINAGELKVKAN